MAVDGVEDPGEAQAQDGAHKERWEHRFLLPLNFNGRASQKVYCDAQESNHACADINKSSC